MGRFPSPQVALRDANKLATTNMHNELAAALLAQQPQFVTGQQRPRASMSVLYAVAVSYDVRNPGTIVAKQCDQSGRASDDAPQITLAVTSGAVDGLIFFAGVFAYLPTPGLYSHGKQCDGIIISPGHFQQLMRVQLLQTGGSGGSSSTVCSYTYSAFPGLSTALDGTILSPNGSLMDGAGPEMSPARIFPMAASPATVGMAYWNGVDWLLAYAHETAAGVKACVT